MVGADNTPLPSKRKLTDVAGEASVQDIHSSNTARHNESGTNNSVRYDEPGVIQHGASKDCSTTEIRSALPTSKVVRSAEQTLTSMVGAAAARPSVSSGTSTVPCSSDKPAVDDEELADIVDLSPHAGDDSGSDLSD